MRIAVIGAGSWGTATASLLGGEGHDVVMWARKDEVANAITVAHRNPRYLSEYELPATVCGTSDISAALDRAEAVVMATPSSVVRETAFAIQPFLAPETPVLILSKGVEQKTFLLMTQILAEVLGNEDRLAALSGPNHAEEVIKCVPSATVIASTSLETAEFFQELFNTPTFRTYTSSDVVGVELCAAAKNVIAIASGAGDGMGFGDNTRATTITRGLAEISRLVKALGGDPLTCMGLAGMGDLIATCTSRHSRNRLLGEMVAKGETIDDFTARTHMVAEGAVACISVHDLAQTHGIELPIVESVYAVLYEGKDMKVALNELMRRELKEEFK